MAVAVAVRLLHSQRWEPSRCVSGGSVGSPLLSGPLYLARRVAIRSFSAPEKSLGCLRCCHAAAGMLDGCKRAADVLEDG